MVAPSVRIMATINNHLEHALVELLAGMRVHLPASVQEIPEPNVSITSVSERALAVGNWRGSERRGALGEVALKGGRLDAVVQFQLWSHEPTGVDTAINELHGRLLAAKDDLRAAGFLRIKGENPSSAQSSFVPDLKAWRKTTDYRVLYEFRYEDTDDAESLIAKIPVAINRDFGESMMITDDLARWDNTSAPTLMVRGPFEVAGIHSLVFLPAPEPTGTVTLTRSFEGAVGPPPIHPTLAAFLAAVSGRSPLQRHARVAFASLNDFLAELGPVGDSIVLGDWDADGVPDQYDPQQF